MKRFLAAICSLILAVNALAQVAVNPVLTRSGTKLVLDGQRLTPGEQAALLSDISGKDYTQEWNEIQHWRPMFNVLIVGGGIVATAGLGYATALAVYYSPAVFVNRPIWPFAWGSLLVGGVGVGAMCAGLHYNIMQNNRLDAIVNAYNGAKALGEPVASLSVGPTRNGVGLTIVF